MQLQLWPSQGWSGLIPSGYFVWWYLDLARVGLLENCKAAKLLWVALCANNISYPPSSRKKIVNWTHLYHNGNSKKLSFIQFVGWECTYQRFSSKSMNNISSLLHEILFLLPLGNLVAFNCTFINLFMFTTSGTLTQILLFASHRRVPQNSCD